MSSSPPTISAELVATMRLKQLELVVATRNIEIQATWTRFSAIAVLQTASLASYALAFERIGPRLGICIAIAGISIGLLWMGLIGRTQWWAEYWNRQIRTVEAKVFPTGTHVLGPQIRAAGPSLSFYAQCVAAVFALVWVALLSWQVSRLLAAA